MTVSMVMFRKSARMEMAQQIAGMPVSEMASAVTAAPSMKADASSARRLRELMPPASSHTPSALGRHVRQQVNGKTRRKEAKQQRRWEPGERRKGGGSAAAAERGLLRVLCFSATPQQLHFCICTSGAATRGRSERTTRHADPNTVLASCRQSGRRLVQTAPRRTALAFCAHSKPRASAGPPSLDPLVMVVLSSAPTCVCDRPSSQNDGWEAGKQREGLKLCFVRDCLAYIGTLGRKPVPGSGKYH